MIRKSQGSRDLQGQVQQGTSQDLELVMARNSCANGIDYWQEEQTKTLCGVEVGGGQGPRWGLCTDSAKAVCRCCHERWQNCPSFLPSSCAQFEFLNHGEPMSAADSKSQAEVDEGEPTPLRADVKVSQTALGSIHSGGDT